MHTYIHINVYTYIHIYIYIYIGIYIYVYKYKEEICTCAALMPASESSNAMHPAGSTPSAAQPCRYMKGEGLCRSATMHSGSLPATITCATRF